jgi:hypothetical protein
MGLPAVAQDRSTNLPTSASDHTVTEPAQSSRNVDLLGSIDTVGIIRCIAAEGDYAYIGDEWYGLRIVDVSDPTAPVEVGSFEENDEGLQMSPHGIAIVGDYLYSADGGFSGSGAGIRTNGLRVYDISDPTSPVELGAYWPDEPWTARNVVVVGNIAYLAAGDGGLHVVDVSDPTNPLLLDSLEGPYVSMDVKVSGNYAYVAEGTYGLRVIDISNPAALQEVATLDTRNAREITIVGDHVLVADWEAGLRVIDVSTPTAPQEVTLVSSAGTAMAIAVVNDYAYVAVENYGLRVYDVYDPTTPVEVGFYQMLSATDVAVVDNTAYVSWYHSGQDSLILRFKFSPSISSVYPTTGSAPSPVMQGGTAYRYFRLHESDGSTPITNTTVSFSDGYTATTDAGGYLTYTVAADSLGGQGSYPISIQSITIGRPYGTGGQPAFNVQVVERRYAHSWSYGAIRRASAGLSTGLIAYVQAETNGGLGLTLEESDPDQTGDDRVEMKEFYSLETGGGVGVGLRENVSAGVIDANLDASVTSEASLRGFGSLQARFNQPYADADRKAQSIFLLLSVHDSVTGNATQPFVVQLLRTAEANLSYLDYITAQSAGMAAKVTPLHGHVGAEVGLSSRRSSSDQTKGQTVGFTLLDAGVSRLVAAVLTDYGNEYSISFEDEISVNLTTLSPDIPGLQNQLVGLMGNQARHIHKEYVYDSTTGRLKRILLTLSSEGNPSAFTDVNKKKVAVQIVIPAGDLIPSLVEAVGEAQALSDLETLLQAEPQIAYEVQVEDGSSVSVVPELAIPGTEIAIGMGLQVESLRSLVRERGAFLNGQPYVTEAYTADEYVGEPGKDWADLAQNTLGGLWLLVGDAFSWIEQQVQAGEAWALEVYAQTVEGIQQGAAQLLAPSSARLQAASTAEGLSVYATGPVTVTAVGWVPENASGASSLALQPAMETASGAGFVVGGLYTFQPYTLTIDPPATLVITYTDEAAAEVDENHIAMFRWHPEENNWQAMAAISDTAHNTFTATITQLGTFALGYDAAPPELIILDPLDGSRIANPLPLISTLVTDAGSGIAPDTVQMQLDEQVVAAAYITSTGEFVYLPGIPLAMGVHTVTISAADVAGNSGSASATFEFASRVYLPLVMRE